MVTIRPDASPPGEFLLVYIQERTSTGTSRLPVLGASQGHIIYIEVLLTVQVAMQYTYTQAYGRVT